SAQVLGPPADSSIMSKTDNSKEEYLASEASTDDGRIRLFSRPFWIAPEKYKNALIDTDDIVAMQERIASVQPDMLAARGAADSAGCGGEQRDQQPEPGHHVHIQGQDAAVCRRRAVGELGQLPVRWPDRNSAEVGEQGDPRQAGFLQGRAPWKHQCDTEGR